MAVSRSRDRRRTRRAYVGIVVVALLLFAALSAAWLYLAGRLENEVARQIDRAREEGLSIGCANRDVFGYPFRLGIRCDAVTVDGANGMLRIAGGAIRTAAQLYRPNRIVAEIDGPLLVDTPQAPPVDLRWALTQASATFWREGLDHFALVSDAPVLSLAQPAADRQPLAEAAHTETHVRRREGDLDAAFSATQARLVMPGAPDLPPADLSLDLTVGGAADWLSGRMNGTARERLAGRPITLRSARVDLGASEADLSGTVQFDADGRMSGTLHLSLLGANEIAMLVGQAAPDLASLANTIAAVLPLAGRQENGHTVIDITARNGQLAAGIVPLGTMPRLD
ncbi:DUF2125 domain-containing protein [Aurantimonas sp. MSK8Z-1]|uniref:DUF2125 domain-containing protein n=1 Tax=Mangrovibrevibacter kandeliae TaxID=2968473 RepID=UPI0021181D26|nr:DUF2125 domain-containing protein [Aurantimonas sp. MSK8Z-1]MCW4116562.1 DUF2125 domain-containing protein [Aurantimonas sp. MSK8Z-1]